ncbi:hypothetical protein L218DRAFT_336969 [Marasmius fiardii PR-910]|nr:hypothetical protein L218DRAFT_336969 [Marasmius fiardii PR-910]
MSTIIPPHPTSPNPATRRKVHKTHPLLPLSAFTPPNSGTSDKFPLPPSPSTVHPEKVVDANVAFSSELDLSRWRNDAGQILGSRVGGLVVTLPNAGADPAQVISRLAADKSQTSVLSVVIPFQLDAEPDESLTAVLHGVPIPVSLSTTFNAEATPQNVSTLKWALQQGRPVDIDIQADLSEKALFESLEDLIVKTTVGVENVPPIILSNLLPPPHQLELPIVKLMNHPTYRAFQAQVAALSLYPQLYIKYLPPSWGPVPTASADSTLGPEGGNENRQQKEWKRRIKMFLGPVMEAFGYQRIIFGSSPSKTSNAGDWYELARESLAELGVEQEAVDAVFFATAQEVYV